MPGVISRNSNRGRFAWLSAGSCSLAKWFWPCWPGTRRRSCMPHRNRADRIAKDKRRYALNGEKMRQAAAKHYADHGDRIRAERAAKRTPEVKAIASQRQCARYAALRAEMIAAFGSYCTCCGEREPKFLELDHIASDGADHRRKIGRGAYRTYCVAKKDGWPKGQYRLLCSNCNQGRARNGGVCPHEEAHRG